MMQFFSNLMNSEAREFDNMLKKAQAGDAAAQCNVGIAYRDGKGVPQNHVNALSWFEKSAAQKYGNGQRLLGFMHENGLGTNRDEAKAKAEYEKAFTLLETAAQQNDPVAQRHLAGWKSNILACKSSGTRKCIWRI